MITCRADPSLQRPRVGDFAFPLGVYPVEPMTPKPGYAMDFEPADGDDESGEWEEWPDRYVFDVVLPFDLIRPFWRQLFTLMPGRVYPILDVLGQDAYREIDPYISYELVSLDRFTDAVRRYADYFFEDGMVGFGAMADDPFFYVFVDEHKIITIRVEPPLKDKVEKLLKAFGLEAMEEPAGADSAAHEHRAVLVAPGDQPNLLSSNEIVELLKEEWQLLLNVDPDSNVDDEGTALGTTHWRCLVRCEFSDRPPKYAELLFDADTLREAEELAFDALDRLPPPPIGGAGASTTGTGGNGSDSAGGASGAATPGPGDAGGGAGGVLGVVVSSQPTGVSGLAGGDVPAALPPGGSEGAEEEELEPREPWEDAVIVALDRVSPEQAAEVLGGKTKRVPAAKRKPGTVRLARWLD